MERYFSLLKKWCDGLIARQITQFKDKELYGGILCPACALVHGRCMGLVHPLLYLAEKTGDNIKQLAREEADSIIKDAKHNASRIVNESLLKAEKIENQADVLERNVKIFKRKLKIIVEQQMAVVDEIETLDLYEK